MDSSVKPDTPARILILSGARGDTRRYRTLHLHQQLKLAGLDSTLTHLTEPRLSAMAKQAEVLVLHRAPFDRYIDSLIAGVRGRGGLVLADTDDLIFEPQAFQWIDSPDFRDPLRARLYRQDMQRHRRTMEACDGVITSTVFLAGEAAALGKPCRVHRNAANLELAHLSALARSHPRPPDGKVIIGYASGTPTHNRDFEQAAPALQQFLQDYPQAELLLIGRLDLGDDWAPYMNRLRRFPLVPWRELPAWLAQLDINLAPLVPDNPFAQCKSEIKYMEAALAGVPTAASRTDSFQYAIRDGENGLLCLGTDEWQAALVAMLDTGLRQRMAAAALADVLERYSPQARALQAVAMLNELSAECGRPFRWNPAPPPADPAGLWWPPAVDHKPSLLEMGWYSLRHRGLHILARQAWVYLRRSLAPVFPFDRK
jgi:glycosyltransferase involved in cell wall biosynthesis